MTLRIRHDMPLATLDLLAGVEAAWPARFCCLDALTIDDGRRRFFIATAQPARDAKEPFAEEVKGVAVTKPVEIILDSRESWKALRQQCPLAARRGDILHRLSRHVRRQLNAISVTSMGYRRLHFEFESKELYI